MTLEERTSHEQARIFREMVLRDRERLEELHRRQEERQARIIIAIMILGILACVLLGALVLVGGS